MGGIIKSTHVKLKYNYAKERYPGDLRPGGYDFPAVVKMVIYGGAVIGVRLRSADLSDIYIDVLCDDSDAARGDRDREIELLLTFEDQPFECSTSRLNLLGSPYSGPGSQLFVFEVLPEHVAAEPGLRDKAGL